MLKKTLTILLTVASLHVLADTQEEAQAKEYVEKLKIRIVQHCQKQNLESNSDMRACIRETMDEVIARMVHEQKIKELQQELTEDASKQ